MIELVDACVLIDALRGHPAAESTLTGTEELVASEITRYEVLSGMKSDEVARTEDLFDLFHWVPVTENVGRRGAELYQEHSRAHPGIDDLDYIVAATALELELPLLTRNVRHFPMLPGLEPVY